MPGHERYLLATEQLREGLLGEPTTEEIDERVADIEARTIDNSYENYREGETKCQDHP